VAVQVGHPQLDTPEGRLELETLELGLLLEGVENPATATGCALPCAAIAAVPDARAAPVGGPAAILAELCGPTAAAESVRH